MESCSGVSAAAGAAPGAAGAAVPGCGAGGGGASFAGASGSYSAAGTWPLPPHAAAPSVAASASAAARERPRRPIATGTLILAVLLLQAADGRLQLRQPPLRVAELRAQARHLGLLVAQLRGARLERLDRGQVDPVEVAHVDGVVVAGEAEGAVPVLRHGPDVQRGAVHLVAVAPGGHREEADAGEDVLAVHRQEALLAVAVGDHRPG